MKPLPEALYPFHICSSDYSWPAGDIFWSEKAQRWICRECWSEDMHGEQGPSLKEELATRTQ